MEFFTACYRQKEGNASSLLLQQYQYRRSQIVFACICTEENAGKEGGRAGAYMTERLLAWFRGLNLKKLAKSREKGADALAERLTEAVMEADRELNEGKTAGGVRVDLAGILCVDDIFIMAYRGTLAVYLINTAFGRVWLSRLDREREGEKLNVRMGAMEPDVGLLFATEGFCRYVPEDMIREGLYAREIATETQLEKHLAELGKEGEARGGSGIGAIMLRTGR